MNVSWFNYLNRREKSCCRVLLQVITPRKLRHFRSAAPFFYFLLFIFCFHPASAQLKRFVYSEPQMGSSFNIIFYSGDTLNANHTARDCFRLVDSLVSVFSDYIDSSELNRLCARAGSGEPFMISPALLDILLQSKTACEKTSGMFDITLGPVTRLWRKARKEKLFPENEQVKEKLLLTGFNKIQIDSARQQALLLQKGMQLDLGGIAQGYIAQKVIDLLKAKKITNALVDVSGDIVAIGAPPNTKGWTVGVNVPGQTDKLLKQNLRIHNKAVTTSGDAYQFMEHDGKRYSHIIDPHTGYGITSQKNVTVIAGEGTLADWLTKACSILPIEKAKQLAQSLHAEVLIAEIRKGKVVLYETAGFAKYWK